MAVAFVQKAERMSPGLANTYTPALPAGVTTDNLLILDVSTYSDAVTTPSGWTSVLASNMGSFRRQVWVKKAAASEPNPVLVITNSNSVYWHVVILEYSGQDTTTPLDGTASDGTADSDTSVNTPAITTTVNGSMVVYFFLGQAGPAETITVPAGSTQRNNNYDPNTYGRLVVADLAAPTAGTIAATNFTRSAAAAVALGGTLAVRAAGGGGGASTFVPQIAIL